MVAYRSDMHEEGEKKKNLQLYRQDNGLFGVGNSGLSKVTLSKHVACICLGSKKSN